MVSSGISDGTPAVWLMGGADISLGTLVSSESKMVEENENVKMIHLNTIFKVRNNIYFISDLLWVARPDTAVNLWTLNKHPDFRPFSSRMNTFGDVL